MAAQTQLFLDIDGRTLQVALDFFTSGEVEPSAWNSEFQQALKYFGLNADEMSFYEDAASVFSTTTKKPEVQEFVAEEDLHNSQHGEEDLSDGPNEKVKICMPSEEIGKAVESFVQQDPVMKLKKCKRNTLSVVCELCGTLCKSRYMLKKHCLQKHEGKWPKKPPKVDEEAYSYTCELCGSCFKTRQILKVHIKRHTQERPWVCNICGKSYKVQGDLHYHKTRIHEGKYERKPLDPNDMKYACPQCGRKFHNKDLLNRHVKYVHTEERPHVCAICGSRYKTMANLRQHMQGVHEGKFKNEWSKSKPKVTKALCMK